MATTQHAHRMRREVEHQVDSRRDDGPRLRLCRLEGRGVGPDQGHGPHQPRPRRMRALFLVAAAQLLHRHDRRRHVRHDAVHLRLPGEGHRVRRRQEARQDHRRDRGAVPAHQRHHDPVRVPDRPDRRRHRGGVEEEGQGDTARPSCRCAAKASAACRSRSATTSPTTRSATGCSTRRRSSTRPAPTTSTSSATTTSAATPGPRASCWRRWACGWSATGRATRRSPRSSARRRRS